MKYDKCEFKMIDMKHNIKKTAEIYTHNNNKSQLTLL